MKRVFLTNNTPVKFNFKQDQYSFKVQEQLKYKLLKRGSYRLIRATKIEKSTIELIDYISEVLKISPKEFGYAGLKDKHATTVQYLSLPKDISISKFKNSKEVELEELGFIANRLKIGELLGNRFVIKLKSIDENNYILLQNALDKISKYGFANFFGHQRFGALNDATQKGELVAKHGKRAKSQQAKIMLAAYQAKFFNEWLNYRLKLSKEIAKAKSPKELKLSPTLLNTIANTQTLFKLLPGDLGFVYNSGRKKYELVNDIAKYSQSFMQRKFYPTGVLYGSDVRLSSTVAGKIEREFIDSNFNALRGARRAAWVFPKDITTSYNPSKKEAKISFFLPAGSYATVLIEEIANKIL
jgi:tRNA pseudouridine13 synthase